MTSSQKSYRCPILEAGSALHRLSRLAGSALLLIGTTLSSPSASAESPLVNDALTVTPLVLKDGRIARVSVHTIPFPVDKPALASKTATELAAFTQQIATDCFLTAQVIGHVDKKETSGRETVDIHRLARSRADTIQESLIQNGLPAESIASVWDWQFMVQHARATLWVFRLTAGEDCEDEALSPDTGGQIAQAQPLEEQTAAMMEQSPPAATESGGRQSHAVEHRVVAAALPTTTAATKPVPASIPKTARQADTRQAVKPALAPAADGAAPTQLGALDQGSAKGKKKGSAKITKDGALEIVFATNSSYFPEGAGEQLRAFLKTLDKNGSYIVRVQTSVDGGSDVSGASSDDEASRYSAWLAERRYERVRSWLVNNGDGRTLKIEPTLLENDGSRRVRVEMNPLG